jgi:hypothetical protein
MKFPLRLLIALLPLGVANAQFNINDAFVANELGTGAITFPGPLGGTLRLGHNLTPATPATLLTTGLIHTDSWASAPALQGWYFPNGAIVPSLVVNTTGASVDTGFAITGAKQIHMHPGNPSGNASGQPVSAAVLRFTVATGGVHTISGEFQSLNSGTVTVDVLRNGVSILTSGAGSDATSFFEVVTLTAGDFIDFVVDDAGDIGADSTGLYANIVQGSPPVDPVDISLDKPEPIGPATRRGPFVFSEIMYHPATRTDGKNVEFIELYNSQPWAEDLTGYRISGDVSFDFPSGTTIPALGRLVVAAVPADVQAAYGITGVLGPFTGQLKDSGGALRLRNEGDGIAFEVDYDSEHSWTAAPDGGGPSLVLARPSLGMTNPLAWAASALVGGSPGAAEPEPANPQAGVVINEVLANSAGVDFVELHNSNPTAVDLSGCVLTDTPDVAKYTFPPGTVIPPVGFLSRTETELGFAPHATGDSLYLKSPDGTRILDTVRFGAQENSVSSGRTPNGARNWSQLASSTPGAGNSFTRRAEVVISEIMYHAITTLGDDEFIELHNRSAASVNLGGWRLRGEADFDIPSGTTLAAGARLVIAKNPTHLIAAYPGLSGANVRGPFTGSLSDRTGRISLQKPVAYTPAGGTATTIRVEVDAVDYGTGGRWGKWSDGGGSSLELTDAHADARLAPNWADSDESAKSGWKTIEVTGVLDNGMSAAPANQVQLFLLGAGECLVDDVEVIPSGGSDVVPNGAFSTATGWTFQGSQENSTISGGVLNLRATDRGGTANRVFANLTSTLATGSTATIRARVKWLRGSPEFLIRLRGSWLEASGNVLTTSAFGTPGVPNSREIANAAPAITEVTHRPILPSFGQSVTVFVRVSDPDGVGTATLQYRIDPSPTLANVAMTSAGAGWFSAQIPAQATGTLVAFRIAATDTPGAAALFPNDAPARECLVRWGDPKPTGSLGAYRLWMTQATRDRWAARDKNSNAPLDITFVYGGVRAIYNAGAKYSGSWAHTGGYSSPVGNACDYTLDFPDDDRLLGETSAVVALPGTVGDDTTLQREQLAWWMARKLKMPALHRRFVRVFVNGQQRQQVLEDTQQPAGQFLAEWFPNDDGGRLHKSQDWVEFQDNAMSALGDVRATLGNFTTTGGVKKTGRYRWLWAPRAGDVLDNDFADFFALVDAHNQASLPAYETQVASLVDVSSWMRAMALQRIAGNWDSYGWSIGKNMYAYKPRLGRWSMIPWDIDFSFGQVGDSAVSNLFTNTSEHIGNESMADALMTKFRNTVAFRREYWHAFSDAANGPMAVADARIDLVNNGLIAEGITPSGIQTVKTYTTDRRNYILGQLATVAATFTVAGPTTFSTANSTLSLSGTAPVSTATIEVNGHVISPVWSTVTAWSASYLLAPGINTLVIRSRDGMGNVLGTTTLTVTYTGTASWAALRINEWMASNNSYLDPVDDDADDWLEIYNPTGGPVNLANWRLSDNPALPAKFAIPGGYSIPAGGRLLVWADNETVQNAVANSQLHAGFKLGASGGAILLSAPDGTLIDSVSFGLQTTDLTEGRYPDGTAGTRALTLPTPGTANALTEFTELTRVATTVTLTFTTTPGLHYQIEYSDDLTTWWTLGIEQVAAGATLTISDPAASGNRRFYRARVSD